MIMIRKKKKWGKSVNMVGLNKEEKKNTLQ